MSAQSYYLSRQPPSPDAVSLVLQALGQAVASRRTAIQYNNPTAEQAADSAITNQFHTLSRDSVYPPTFPPADRKRTTKFFAKLASKYPRLSRKAKDSTLHSLEGRVGRGGNTQIALVGLATLAATGLVVGGVAMVATDDSDDRFYGDFPGAQPGVESGHGADSTALLGDDESSSAGGDDWGLDPSGRVNGMGSNMDTDTDGGGGFLEACFECFSGICGS